MTEFELIAKLLPGLHQTKAVVAGAGHDCAALDLGLPSGLLLFKTDATVEGVHFTSETPPDKVGRKSLARALSDIAAMGGTPTACLVTIGLPPGFDSDRVLQLYAGINEAAGRFGVAVAGGETTVNPGGIFISMAVIGKTERLITREGAKPGHAIFVTGELGGSITGKHLDFEPRLKEGLWLSQHFTPSAMIDVSDGLAGDLRHILNASKVGAELLSSAIPISRAAKLQARGESSAKPPLLAALTDGEDFELLFTIAAEKAVPLLDAWKEAFPQVKLSCIGKINSTSGLRIRDKEGIREIALHGYTHFKQS